MIERKRPIDLFNLNGRFGQITIQREFSGSTQEKIIFGTINLDRSVIQEFLWKDIPLEDIRVVDFVDVEGKLFKNN